MRSLSSVFCLLSARLASRVPRHFAARLASRVSRPASSRPLAAALGLALALLASGAGAMTNNLTYAASFGRFDASSAVVPFENLTTNVTLTVAIYPTESATSPFWCRRLATEVVRGDFAVVLSDDAGVDVSLEEFGVQAKYARLEELFAGTDLDTACWIAVTRVLVDDRDPLPGATVVAFPRGRIAGAPFALVAERAVGACGSFCVRGSATVASLKATGSFAVEGGADFSDSVTFYRLAKFGAEGLVVTGAVSKSTMDGIGTFRADTLTASKNVSAGTFRVTGGSATVLTPVTTGFTPPTEMKVTGTLKSGGTLTAEKGVFADELQSTGTFELDGNGVLSWATDGSLTVPDGVYEADSTNLNLVAVSSENSWTDYTNGTKKDALVTIVAGAKGGSHAETKIGSDVWAHYGLTGGSSGFFISVLYPMAPDEKLSIYNVRTRYTKELTK